MIKKIGILTYYYDSINYGGNFQAYALPYFLEKNGYEAKQISCLYQQAKGFLPKNDNIIKKFFRHGLKGTVKILYDRLWTKKHKNDIAEKCELRRKSFAYFNQNVISHTEKVYSESTISAALSDFDCFITGSDQVWNLSTCYFSGFLLDFVHDKPKLSYAASISLDTLSEDQKKVFKSSLKDFTAISVREGQAVKLLEGLTSVQPIVTLDPTLLLGREDWEKVCGKRLVQEDYVFCYYLGDNPISRKMIKAFARKRGLKIVAIPMTSKDLLKPFGDIVRYDISPEQFLSLVKYAKYVFTDSFHAVVFSKIFEKQFFVYNRSPKGEMSSRIYNITKLFHTEERYCDTKEKQNLKYIESLKEIDYFVPNVEFDELKKKSIDFLLNNLEGKHE